MSILVMSCSEWVGYHIVDTLLDNDYKVDVIPTANNDDLSMFFVRNSSFSIVQADANKKYSVGILVGEVVSDIQQEFDQLILINPVGDPIRSDASKKRTVIHTPMLFGEWMPMNEEGILHPDALIAFESEEFTKNALYVGDFTKALLQWLKASNLPPVIHVNMEDDDKKGYTKLEKSVFIRDNIPKQERVESVIKHYRSKRKFTI